MRPLTPPAAFISSIASSPALRIADPGSAYGPVNGPGIPPLTPPPPPAVLELPHAPMTNKASAARLVTRSRRFNIDNLPFVSAARAACVMRRLGPPPSSRLLTGRECAGGRRLLHRPGLSIRSAYATVKLRRSQKDPQRIFGAHATHLRAQLLRCSLTQLSNALAP